MASFVGIEKVLLNSLVARHYTKHITQHGNGTRKNYPNVNMNACGNFLEHSFIVRNMP